MGPVGADHGRGAVESRELAEGVSWFGAGGEAEEASRDGRRGGSVQPADVTGRGIEVVALQVGQHLGA